MNIGLNAMNPSSPVFIN